MFGGRLSWDGRVSVSLGFQVKAAAFNLEDELGTELHSQEFPISKPAVKLNFTLIIIE